MSQQLQLRGQLTLTNGSQTVSYNLTDQINTTGSTSIANNASIPTGSWTSLNTGSNANFRLGYFYNTDLTSSVKLALGAEATGSYSAYLNPGDYCLIPNQAGNALALYAEATGSNPIVILQYLLIEN